ncbi:unnamed protein product [Closterium sp. NIES-53]
MIALCQEHRLEHRTKHIALRTFLARELQQRGQLRLAYVATRANIADIFTKALLPGDHQPCFAFLDWSFYIDDILVFSRDKQQHLADLEAVFKILDEHGLLTKGSKCEFLQDRLEFLGHVISEVGVEIDPKKLDTVKAWHPPTNITELQSFF